MLRARLSRLCLASRASHTSHERLFASAAASAPASAAVFSPSVLRGRLALISGGTGAIGFAIARALALHGAQTVLLSRSQQRATDAAAAINALCPTACVGYECDVTSSEQVTRTVGRVTDTLGPLSILVNAHGVSHDGLLPRLSDDALHATLSANLTSCLYLLRAASRSFLAHRAGGSVVTVGSVVGSQGNVGQVAYAASKAGLVGMTRSASREMARYGVNVNLIEAGWIEGEAEEGRAGMMGAGGGERWAKRLAERDWAGRPGSVDEVASAALFLCTPAASYIQGTVLRVDGGLRI